ncbi:MAG: ABC transporter substrate-binding protein [Dehalococcoidia bacterium]
MSSKSASLSRRGPRWSVLLGVSLVLGALFLAACGSSAQPAAAPAVVEKVVEVVKEVPVEKVVQVVKEVPVEKVVVKEVAVEPARPTSVTVTDVAGRTVTVKRPVERVILGEGRQIYEIAALQPEEPFKGIAGWVDDFKNFDRDGFNKYKEKFPEVEDIPLLGNVFRGQFSVEQAIALKPDLVTVPLGAIESIKESGLIEQLEKAGIQTVFVDYRENPLETTIPSTLLMGRLLGKEERAQEVVDFYQQQLNQVYSRLAKIDKARPLVLLEPAAGFSDPSSCCRSYGRHSLGYLIERAGGKNLGADLFETSGTLNPEQVVAADPDVIIVTGAAWPTASGSPVSLGYYGTPEEARGLMKGLVSGRAGWDGLQAVDNGRFHAVWHQFYTSIYNFAALQQFAKWFYPEEFNDLDPKANFEEFHDKFLPIDYSGTFWVSLEK